MDQASNQYLRDAILTASPEQLHLMLYDGLIRFTRQAIEGIEQKDYEKSYNGLTRAQRIIVEMLNSLNYEVDQELCTRMAGLYNFIYRKLVDAGTQNNADLAREALKIIEFNRETWVMLMDRLRHEQGKAAASDSQTSAGSTQTHDLVAGEATYGTLSVEG